MLPDTDPEELRYLIALTMIDGIGSKTGALLLRSFGSAKAALQAPLKELMRIDGMGETRARACRDQTVLAQADAELSFLQKHHIAALGTADSRYPSRFAQCADPSLLLYYKGAADLNATRIVAIIGTRKNTEYGQRITEELIDGLRTTPDVIISSGLAYGIDAIAHRQSLKAGIPTIGVVGHGLDKMYPSAHRALAKEMLEKDGGLLTEFPSGTKLSPSNFPVRNRIVAGISDVTVVVESDEKGGAMITAYMAASYNREVAAIPGRVYDAKSAGPNKLIRMSIAACVTSATDLLNLMNWNSGKKETVIQPKLLLNFTDDEQLVVKALEGSDGTHADEVMITTKLSSPMLAATLLQLEMQGVVKSLPGKRYRLS